MAGLRDYAPALIAGGVAVIVAWWQFGGHLASVRRRLVHEAEVLEKLPPSPARDELERHCRRQTYRYLSYARYPIWRNVARFLAFTSTSSLLAAVGVALTEAEGWLSRGAGILVHLSMVVLVMYMALSQQRRQVENTRLIHRNEPELVADDELRALKAWDKLVGRKARAARWISDLGTRRRTRNITG